MSALGIIGYLLALYIILTRPDRGDVRLIVREEMDAENIWLSGPGQDRPIDERRERMAQDRNDAIKRGQREGF